MIRINKGISVKEVEADQMKDIKTTTKTPTMVAIMKGEPMIIAETMISEVDQMNNRTINLVKKLLFLQESK